MLFFDLDKSEWVGWGFYGCGSTHWWTVGFCFWKFTLSLNYRVKDWMIPKPDVNYVVFERNPKYDDDEFHSWSFPKD